MRDEAVTTCTGVFRTLFVSPHSVPHVPPGFLPPYSTFSCTAGFLGGMDRDKETWTGMSRQEVSEEMVWLKAVPELII